MSDNFILRRVDDGEEFPLTFASLLVGRSDSCGIRVLSGQASREHARIKAKDDGAVVEDLHSTNGTFVNDKKIEVATHIKPGDVVRFDQERFSLQRENQSSETIFARPIDTKPLGRMSIEEQDEEDANSTVYRQTYTMPMGWSDFDDNSNDKSSGEDRKQQALKNFIDKSFQTSTGTHLIALVIAKGDEPPTIKTVATNEKEQRWSVGRGASCDIIVEQPDISETHCELIFKEGHWTLEDKKSANGIWHKNKRIESIKLHDGIELFLASLNLTVHIQTRT